MRSHRYAVSGTRPRGGRPSARLGRSVLDARSPFYRFETFEVGDGHGGRWRMRIGIPRARSPRRGFPALWMLDGNRALAQFDHAWLQGLAAAPTPRVLVFVAPDNDLLVDLPRRAHDYTFQPADHPFLAAPTAPPGPVGGGADALLEVLTGQAMPALARRVPLDRERQALWGHSLAGLFVLHALYSGRGPFTEYAAASPSLWWSQGALLGDPEQHFSREGPARAMRLWLFLGGAERAGHIDPHDRQDPHRAALLEAIAGAPADAAARLAERLATVPRLAVRYQEFPALQHTAVFRAALRAALQQLAGLPVRGRRPRRS
ncbi:alpha/beta hydrolase [Xanthomonas campestris]|uniref:alpha/beta hydrolase n=1 Tax=Xanthomonas campestris TaxID=339 RepID=UPI001CBD9A6A|nr:alpha/beta hydrolase-fold protein [Xanthomonas campestris]